MMKMNKMPTWLLRQFVSAHHTVNGWGSCKRNASGITDEQWDEMCKINDEDEKELKQRTKNNE